MELKMTKQCAITGKKRVTGNNVSHAKNRRKRVFNANIHTKKFTLESGKVIKLKVSAKGLRIIDKLGIDAVYKSISEK
jgi:large subunit ribosomal protein L28